MESWQREREREREERGGGGGGAETDSEKVSALAPLIYKDNIESPFQNVCLHIGGTPAYHEAQEP